MKGQRLWGISYFMNEDVMDDVEQIPRNETDTHNNVHLQEFENDPMEDGNI